MSRIGKLPIVVPEGVEITVTDTNRVKVKGKLGELEQLIDPAIKVKVENGEIVLERPTESKDHKSKHGLYRSLINNMVMGVTEGYKTVQELVGVGYKAEVKGQLLDLSLGFSHHIFLELPPEIKIEAVSTTGKKIESSVEIVYDLTSARYHALIIAVEKYNDPNINDLEQPVKDATRFYDIISIFPHFFYP